MSAALVGDFLIGLAGIIKPVRIYFHWRPQLQDANDEMVLETAINGRAEAIVTHNVRDFSLVGLRFNLRVLRPAELAKELSK
jgi:predicted nucleic acid-binding protein